MVINHLTQLIWENRKPTERVVDHRQGGEAMHKTSHIRLNRAIRDISTSMQNSKLLSINKNASATELTMPFLD